ncbi:deoxyribose-phosphate aldolase [Luteolibacter ambystomatis]|uniref:Deoxyribose-phosphate aldolase n=1 Tax=Luteolibacter ambystomatis TaxID=2824561 RepID=A0A975G8B0_9BACT|nr:deoxyribose-phosphate aldolase [Luteolibacter ambystomatis]QUE50155.1 deoxyribose-phosphate aldolase [Luteolibacter ambystomatis]
MVDPARLIGLLDLTTLGSTDTDTDVQALAARAITPVPGRPDIRCAAVCVWPNFASVAAESVKGSGLDIACVAGAFPFSQAPLAVKVAEVAAAVAAGATEIDIAIHRGLFLSGRHDELRAEIAAMKGACGSAHLKVILETCDLPDDTAIRVACRIALEGGADFLKTSTGKGKYGATLAHTRVLLEEATAWTAASGKAIGVKPAGGIRTHAEASAYFELASEFFPEVRAENFRIGASTLLDDLIAAL